MSCDYQKLIDKLLDGNLNDDKLTQLKEHALECKECSDKLMQIELTDKIIENNLLNVPYVSNKDSIMKKIGKNESRICVLSVLYKSRKVICAVAAIIVIVVSIQLIKPFIKFRSPAAPNNAAATANTDKDKTNDNVTDDNIQKYYSTVDVFKLKFTMPSNWSAKAYCDNTVGFYENGVDNGGLVVYKNYPYKGEELIRNITPNHSELLWSEDINVPLGKGKMAAFKITPGVASPSQIITFQIGAIIPISDEKAYEILINPKDAGASNKKLFKDIINNIRRDEESDNNQDIYIKNISLKTNDADLSTIALQLMKKYFAQFKENTTEKDLMISDYKINKIDQIKGDNNDFTFCIDYSLKPADIKSYVLCGNGHIDGEWVVDKVAFVGIDKADGVYKIKSIGTSP